LVCILHHIRGTLHLSGDYAVAELMVEPDDWLAERTLRELRLANEGVLVLGVEKPGGEYLGTPRGDYQLMPEDNLLLYGPHSVLVGLDKRRAGSEGNWQHLVAAEKRYKQNAKEEERAQQVDVNRSNSHSTAESL